MGEETESELLSRQEYVTQLRNWIDDVRKYNERMMYGFVCAYATQSNLPNVVPRLVQNGPLNPNVVNNNRNQGQHNPNREEQPPNQNVNVVIAHTTNPSPNNRPGYYVYIIPPMWKRVIAEFIDFLILFVIKMFLTVIILESLDVINVENYGLNYFYKKLQNPKFAMQMSIEILALEILHRVIVCCYETYWLVIQCATPGKKYMGLAVVRAVNVTHMQGRSEELVVAHPCTSLNVRDAVIRALLKNIFIGLLLPICCVLVFFKYNRTGYDLLTHSLVVEYNHPIPTVQQNR